MPVNTRWRGDAPAISQLDTYVVTTYDVTTTWIIAINGKKIQTIGTGGTAITTATALVALLNATTVPQEFKEITWSNVAGASATITATAITPGKPFTIVQTVSGGTGSWVHAAVTVSSGPNDASIGANYDQGVIPAAGDTLIFDQGSSSVLYLLNQSAVALAAINILPGFTGTIGLPSINVDSAGATYIEYRPTYLQYGATAVQIQGGGGRIKLDNGSVQCTWNVLAKAQRADSKIPQVLLKGTHASNAINCNTGDLALGWFNEASTLLTLNANFQTNQAGDSYIWLGANVTLTAPTIVQNGGFMFVNSAITGASIVTVYAGAYTQFGTGGIAAGLSVLGGTCTYNSTGTLGGTPVVAGNGLLDFSQDLRTKTVTNTIQVYGNKAKVEDPNKSVTAFVVKLNKESEVSNIEFGTDVTLTRS